MTGIPVERLKVYCDWSRTGLYDDVDADVSSYVTALSWRYGFQSKYELVAPPSEATIELDNSNGDWNVGIASSKFASKLRRGTLVKIEYDDGFTPVVLYIGKISEISLVPGEFSRRTCSITLTDWMADFQNVRFEPTLAANVTTGHAIVTQVFDSGIVPIPYARNAWILDVSSLGTTTVLYQNTAMTTPDGGQTVLGYVGDNLDTGSGINVRSFLEEMCSAEMDGRLWYDARTMTYKYKDRHGWMQRFPLAGTSFRLDVYNMKSGDYSFGTDVVNKLKISVLPRKLGTPGSALYSSTSPLQIPPQGSRRFVARYSDPDSPQGSCAALTTIPLVAGVDFVANTQEDGLGTDVTSSIQVSAEYGRSSTAITVFNSLASSIYLTTLQVRGTPLLAKDELEVVGMLPSSIADNGLYERSLTIAGISDVSLAQDYMNLMLAKMGTPKIEWNSWTCTMTGSSANLLETVVFLGLGPVGRVLYVAEPWSSTSQRTVSVIGESCTVDIRSNTWEYTLILEPFDYTAYWVLDWSELDEGTVVGF